MKRIENLEPWLDPELREIFRCLPSIAIGPEVIQRERVEIADVLRQIPRLQAFGDRFIPGLEHDPLVRLRMYRPAEVAAPAPALIWMHGGGWTLGVPEVDEPILAQLAERAQLCVVSVDYRLSPEHHFPAAIRDAEAATRWTLEHAAELGVDPDQLYIGGSSAGANLAAGLCVKLRDERGPRPALQLLLFPALDDRLDTASMHAIADTRTIHREFMRECWHSYLGSQRATHHASPGRAEDLRDLAPALIIAAELDPLRDEAVRYADRLWQAAVSCELHVFKGAIHGFDALMPRSRLAGSLGALVLEALQRARR